MSIKLVTQGGSVLTLNPSFRIRGLPLQREVPTFVVEGRDGEIVHERHIRLRPSPLVLTGFIYGDTDAEAQANLDDLNFILSNYSEFKLYVGDGSRYVNVVFQSMTHTFEEGTARRAARVTLTLTAYNPEWLESSPQRAMTDVSVTGGIDIDIVGSKFTYPLVAMVGGQTGSENPVTTNDVTGSVIQFSGTLGPGELLVCNGETRTALWRPSNALSEGLVQDANSVSIELEGSANDTPGYYVGRYVKILSGTGSGQVRRISSYSGLTRRAYVNKEWTEIPDTSSQYIVYNLAWLEEEISMDAVDIDLPLLEGKSVLSDVGLHFVLKGFRLNSGPNIIISQGSNHKLAILWRNKWS